MYALTLIVLLFLFSGGHCDPVRYKDFGSSAKVNNVDISLCKAEPCPLKLNTNVTFQINFTANEDSKGATTHIYGTIGPNLKVPYPIPEDCCTNHNIKCPITKGNPTEYKLKIYISPAYPKMNVIVQLEVRDDEGQNMVCIAFPVVIIT